MSCKKKLKYKELEKMTVDKNNRKSKAIMLIYKLRAITIRSDNMPRAIKNRSDNTSHQ
jgi:hypothetical protein